MNRIGVYRISMFAALFLLITAGLSAERLWSYTVGATGTEYIFSGGTPELAAREQAVGMDIRGAAIIKPMGMYYGTYLNISVPLVLDVADMSTQTITRYKSGHDIYFSAGLPLGLRVPLGTGRYGLYAGVGPAMMVLADFDSHLWISALMIVEMGFELIERRRVGAGLSIRGFVGMDSLLVDIRDPLHPAASAGLDPYGITLTLGISWVANRN